MINKNLPQDASQKQIQVPASFATQDGTTVPQTSPLAVSSVVITIVPPNNAIEFVAYPSSAMRVSDSPTVTSYDLVAANTKESIPCAGMSAIYVVRDSADLTLNFRFNTL